MTPKTWGGWCHGCNQPVGGRLVTAGLGWSGGDGRQEGTGSQSRSTGDTLDADASPPGSWTGHNMNTSTGGAANKPSRGGRSHHWPGLWVLEGLLPTGLSLGLSVLSPVRGLLEAELPLAATKQKWFSTVHQALLMKSTDWLFKGAELSSRHSNQWEALRREVKPLQLPFISLFSTIILLRPWPLIHTTCRNRKITHVHTHIHSLLSYFFCACIYLSYPVSWWVILLCPSPSHLQPLSIPFFQLRPLPQSSHGQNNHHPLNINHSNRQSMNRHTEQAQPLWWLNPSAIIKIFTHIAACHYGQKGQEREKGMWEGGSENLQHPVIQ